MTKHYKHTPKKSRQFELRRNAANRIRETEMQIESCIDCNSYDDVEEFDSFMRPFGDYWICEICAEERGIEA